MLCWVWWDKMRQIKWVAAEFLTDALNARNLAEGRAVEAIERYNRHIEMCNRVIEGQSSGIGGVSEAGNAALTIRELQTELAASRANGARLQHELDQSKAEHAQMDGRLASLEAEVKRKAAHPDADLVARLERAEAELAGKKARKAKV
jgi:chromosome segregation ATPase